MECPILEFPCPARLSPDFHSCGITATSHPLAAVLAEPAETRAPSAFSAESPAESAQNPVTRLCTACTRLKIRILQTPIFD
jgi:hypothetical protein